MRDNIETQLPRPGTRMTVIDFLNLPETAHRIELISGEVVYPFGDLERFDSPMSPAPTRDHQEVVGDVYMLLRLLKRGRAWVAPTDVVLQENDTTVQPDVIWVADDNDQIMLDRGVRGVPDLLVEVVSPSTKRHDVVTKFQLYERVGVREYWIADPLTVSVDVWVLDDNMYRVLGTFQPGESFNSPALGAQIQVTDIFPPDASA